MNKPTLNYYDRDNNLLVSVPLPADALIEDGEAKTFENLEGPTLADGDAERIALVNAEGVTVSEWRAGEDGGGIVTPAVPFLTRGGVLTIPVFELRAVKEGA